MKVSNRQDSELMATSFNGDAYHVEFLEGYSICAKWTETSVTLAGTLKLQASNNAFADNVNNNENSNATWVDITGSSVAVSGSGSQFWNVSDVFYKAFRVVWTRTSGEGTFEAFIHAKGVQ